jgi:hypothetical protein
MGFHKDQYLDHCFSYSILMTCQKSINDNAKIVLFADDTSIIVNSPNQTELGNTVNKVFQDINR